MAQSFKTRPGTRKGRKPAGQRPLRVGEELRHALAQVLARGDIHDSALAGLSITVSEVRVSPDLKNATAFVLPLGGENTEAALAGLERCTPYLRGQLARLVPLRYSPRLSFRLDESFATASRIEAVLRRPDVAADLKRTTLGAEPRPDAEAPSEKSGKDGA